LTIAIFHPSLRRVPLAWRLLVANKTRLVRSSLGIGFAVLLMLAQLGFEGAFFVASLATLRALDGEVFLLNAAKYRVNTRDPFPRRQLDAARTVAGVASVRPLDADWTGFFWKNPYDGKTFLVQAFAFNPAEPVFLLPEVEAELNGLTAEDSVIVDRAARRFLGTAGGAKESEINGSKVHIVGTFSLGPDFQSDGTLMMSERSFARLLRGAGGNLPDPELGVVKIPPDADAGAVQQALRSALPGTIRVMTKPELIAFERAYQADVSSAGPIFAIGTVVGFVVGMLISYQIIYTDLSEQLPQYATLKAIGYPSFYLVRIVLEQASLNALAGYVPAWLAALALYRAIGTLAQLPMRMTLSLTLLSLALTLVMCLISAMLAVRRVIAADPAEVF
jgi:putative ABC transport system permease protein